LIVLGLSRDEVIGEMLSFLSAGYSTTSTALVWFIFLMSKHSHVQNKLKNELSQYNTQRLSIEQIDSLIYLDCVLREVFRFVPPVIGTFRTLVADDQLPGTGVQLKKGDQVMIPFYNLNRDERYCEGIIPPDQFYPERFINENNNKITSMTFGGGHRQCIGQEFARLELKTICARLMQHVTFGDGGNIFNAGGYKQNDTILPKHIGVTITFD
jgi:cytochrome P450